MANNNIGKHIVKNDSWTIYNRCLLKSDFQIAQSKKMLRWNFVTTPIDKLLKNSSSIRHCNIIEAKEFPSQSRKKLRSKNSRSVAKVPLKLCCFSLKENKNRRFSTRSFLSILNRFTWDRVSCASLIAAFNWIVLHNFLWNRNLPESLDNKRNFIFVKLPKSFCNFLIFSSNFYSTRLKVIQFL